MTFIQYSSKGQISLSLISKHDEMNIINQIRDLPNPVGKTASASFLSKHIALMASYCSLFNSSSSSNKPTQTESDAILNYTFTPAQFNGNNKNPVIGNALSQSFS